MADVTVKRTEDFEATFRGGMLKARAGLGVTSFGMQILRFPGERQPLPRARPLPRRTGGGVFGSRGRGNAPRRGEEHRLEPGVFARVGPSESRKLATGESPATILVLGAIPGEVFPITKFTDEGEPDPLDG